MLNEEGHKIKFEFEFLNRNTIQLSDSWTRNLETTIKKKTERQEFQGSDAEQSQSKLYGECIKTAPKRDGTTISHRSDLKTIGIESDDQSRVGITGKKNHKSPNVSRSILRRTRTYSKDSNVCRPCPEEKLAIVAYADQKKKTINERSEVMSVCKHTKTYILDFYDLV